MEIRKCIRRRTLDDTNFADLCVIGLAITLKIVDKNLQYISERGREMTQNLPICVSSVLYRALLLYSHSHSHNCGAVNRGPPAAP